MNRNSEIKNYICDYFVKEDADFMLIKENARKAGLPKIAIPESLGKLIYLLTKIQKPKKILEIGTLAGYSTLWLAKGAPEAKIITLESTRKHADIARDNFAKLKLSDRITLIEGDALQTLHDFVEHKEEPFDLIFLDADKEGYPDYLSYILKLSKPGCLLLTDNLIPKEVKINAPLPKEQIATKIYHYNKLLAESSELETILSPTIVGEEGRIDALGISIINIANE